MEATNGIEFFQSFDVYALEKEINNFLKNNFKNIIIIKRDIFFHFNECKAFLFYKNENPNLITPEQVKFFYYGDAHSDTELEMKEAAKKFISCKEKVLDVLFCTCKLEKPTSENRPLIVKNYRSLSGYNLIAVFYQD